MRITMPELCYKIAVEPYDTPWLPEPLSQKYGNGAQMIWPHLNRGQYSNLRQQVQDHIDILVEQPRSVEKSTQMRSIHVFMNVNHLLRRDAFIDG